MNFIESLRCRVEENPNTRSYKVSIRIGPTKRCYGFACGHRKLGDFIRSDFITFSYITIRFDPRTLDHKNASPLEYNQVFAKAGVSHFRPS
ncbi:hypothetical protein AUP68_04551 [Ilyonectria robusta]